MKFIFAGLLVFIVLIGVYVFYERSADEGTPAAQTTDSQLQDSVAAEEAVTEVAVKPVPENLPTITAVDHASAVVAWDDVTVFVDPVGEQSQYAQYGRPDIVVITHIHADHLSVDTMIGMLSRDTVVLAPQSVIDEIPLMISNNVITPFAAGTSQEVDGITFTAVPAYNLRPEALQFHPRERGDIGVVMEVDGTRVYLSGDTEGTPEMRALENIDTAIVAMNLPFTMSVDDAADAVAEFSPRVVIPYHYRGREGFSDLDEFERLLNELNPSVLVERKEWY
jgi:L-ascorbate metabolism protein UlaG (beta-lactamase superfamily)